jgi:hypothetical protein
MRLRLCPASASLPRFAAPSFPLQSTSNGHHYPASTKTIINGRLAPAHQATSPSPSSSHMKRWSPAFTYLPETSAVTRDGFRSDTHGYKFGCHYLPHFISNSDTNTNIIEYEYKTDISNSDSHSNTYSIYIMSINFICG